MDALSTANGIIAALAIDRRKSLRRLIANAAAVVPEQIGDAQVSVFKCAVTATLTKHAGAVVLDPEYGLDARPLRAHGCERVP